MTRKKTEEPEATRRKVNVLLRGNLSDALRRHRAYLASLYGYEVPMAFAVCHALREWLEESESGARYRLEAKRE